MEETMKSLKEYTSSKDVIVVDVQPAYEKYIKFPIEEFVSFLDGQRKVLCFYNGNDTGLSDDTDQNIYEFYAEAGLEKDFEDFVFVDKGYGFFRGWMDNDKVPVPMIKQAARLMMSLGVNDSRELDPREIKSLANRYMSGVDNALMIDPIYLPDISPSLVKKFSGSYLVGGGRNECLKEVQIYLSVLNISTITVEKFVY